jgi:hypothetical protein
MLSFEGFQKLIHTSALTNVHSQLASLQAARASGSVSHNDNRQTSNEAHIGEVKVVTQATDAEGIARSIKPALQRYLFAMQGNFSLA